MKNVFAFDIHGYTLLTPTKEELEKAFAAIENHNIDIPYYIGIDRSEVTILGPDDPNKPLIGLPIYTE